MKKTLCFLLAGLLVLCLSACGPGDSAAQSGTPSVESSFQNEKEDVPAMESNPPAEEVPPTEANPPVIETGEPSPAERDPAPEEDPSQADADPSGAENDKAPEEGSSHAGADPSGAEGDHVPVRDTAPAEDEISNTEGGEQTNMTQTAFYVTVGDTTFSATFADNSGAQALRDLLAAGDITIEMSDYAGFEKVGSLGQSLPTSNRQTTTQAGDIVLYQGDQIVIFYGSNSWSYTRLGRIDDLTGWTEALGSGAVSVTFSLLG